MQKTAYEMRISDLSSDVCSSDLSDQCAADLEPFAFGREIGRAQLEHRPAVRQSQRAGVVRHARRGDAADLRGDVGPDREAALRHRIDEAHRILPPRRPEATPPPFPAFGTDPQSVGEGKSGDGPLKL